MCLRSNGVENSNKVLPPAVALFGELDYKIFLNGVFLFVLDFLL